MIDKMFTLDILDDGYQITINYEGTLKYFRDTETLKQIAQQLTVKFMEEMTQRGLVEKRSLILQ